MATGIVEGSEPFQALHAAIGELLKQRWPDTHLGHVFPDTKFAMVAWLIPLTDAPPESSWKGTMPRDLFVVGPTEKKAGITIHIWHPNHPYLLKENADWLKKAGYKPMVGCLQWNRKASPDLAAFAQLLDQIS